MKHETKCVVIEQCHMQMTIDSILNGVRTKDVDLFDVEHFNKSFIPRWRWQANASGLKVAVRESQSHTNSLLCLCNVYSLIFMSLMKAGRVWWQKTGSMVHSWDSAEKERPQGSKTVLLTFFCVLFPFVFLNPVLIICQLPRKLHG